MFIVLLKLFTAKYQKECGCLVYPGASIVVSQALESSPMAAKSPQPIHGPLFQAPVALMHDESVERERVA